MALELLELQSEDDGDEVLPKGNWLPLNSKRVTTTHLQLIAQSLGLPTGMATEELRQLVDGKLLGMEHEPRSVQLVVQETTKIELRLLLVDESGVFVRCGPVMRDKQPDHGDSASEAAYQQVSPQLQDLRAQLEASHRQLEEACMVRAEDQERLQKLEQQVVAEKQRAVEAESRLEAASSSQEELTKLKTELQAEKSKVKQIWRRSCQQLADHDAVVAGKDAEIATLKARLQRLQV